MKRISIIIAALMAGVAFIACEEKPIENWYFSEDITLNFNNDTTYHFRQEFTLNANYMEYTPNSAANRATPYIDFNTYQTPIRCDIINDTITYLNRFIRIERPIWFNYAMFQPITAKIEWKNKRKNEFVFAYTFKNSGGTNLNISATHTCRRISRLSE